MRIKMFVLRYYWLDRSCPPLRANNLAAMRCRSSNRRWNLPFYPSFSVVLFASKGPLLLNVKSQGTIGAGNHFLPLERESEPLKSLLSWLNGPTWTFSHFTHMTSSFPQELLILPLIFYSRSLSIFNLVLMPENHSGVIRQLFDCISYQGYGYLSLNCLDVQMSQDPRCIATLQGLAMTALFSGAQVDE